MRLKPPRIDFSLTPLPGEAPPRPPLRPLERSLLATALLLLAGAWAAGQALDPGTDTAPAEAAAPMDSLEPVSATPADALREARELAHFPWGPVLDALESGLQDGVEVNTLELRATDARLKLGLRAEGAEPALALAGRLTRRPGLAALRITQQDPQQDPANPAAATLLLVTLEGPVPAALWRGSGNGGATP